MKKGIIENIIKKEIDRHYGNAFTEFKTEILLGKNKIANIYLGNLKRLSEDLYYLRYTEPKDVHLSEGKRDIKIKVEGIDEPVTKLWLETGFEFFEKLGEENIKLVWHHCLERIKSSRQQDDIIDLIRKFDKGKGLRLCYWYSDFIPCFQISDEIEPVKRFIDNKYRKEAINLNEAILKNYFDMQEPYIEISQHLFDFRTSATNIEAKKYASMIDEFLQF
jgi:hypothetical protein